MNKAILESEKKKAAVSGGVKHLVNYQLEMKCRIKHDQEQ
jgi:hypothetical protein